MTARELPQDWESPPAWVRPDQTYPPSTLGPLGEVLEARPSAVQVSRWGTIVQDASPDGTVAWDCGTEAEAKNLFTECVSYYDAPS